MSLSRLLVLTIALTTIISINAFGKSDSKVPASSTVTPPEVDDVRCERVIGVNLAEFKSKLVENCNLSKPFSTSLSRLLNDDTYLYCCHKR